MPHSVATPVQIFPTSHFKKNAGMHKKLQIQYAPPKGHINKARNVLPNLFHPDLVKK